MVAFAVGGLREVVCDGATGLLVAKGDVPGLRRGYVSLVQDPTLGDQLGRAGKQFAARFTVEAHVMQLMDLYEEIVAGCV